MSVTDIFKVLKQFFGIGVVVHGVYMNQWRVGLEIILALIVHVKCHHAPSSKA